MDGGLFTIQKQISQGAGFLFLHKEIPLENQNPVALMKKVSALSKTAPHFLFQKSVEQKGSHGPALTIIGFEAFEIMTVVDGRVTVQRNGDSFEIEGQPFDVISERLKKYKVVSQRDLPFFQGGAMGYFGYDSVRYVEPKLKESKGAFEKLNGSKEADSHLALFQKFFIIDHVAQKVFILSGVTAENAIAEKAERQINQGLEELNEMLTACSVARANFLNGKNTTATGEILEVSPSSMKSSLGKQKFTEGVLKLKEHIQAGDIFQAVLSEKFEFKLNVKPIELFEVLYAKSPSAYQFYFTSGEDTYLGTSPEMLISCQNGIIESHPIAGTRPRGDTLEDEKKFSKQLLESPKEKAEHLMLVDLARNDVGRVSKAGSVKVPQQMEIKKFPGVLHLVSRVTGELKKGKTALEALAASFPAGTLSGAPKVRAMQLLSEIEGVPRGFYGGAVVLASLTGDFDSCIAIRSVEVHGSCGAIQAGAGIVLDSQPEREYAEIIHKTKALRQALAMTESFFGEKS